MPSTRIRSFLVATLSVLLAGVLGVACGVAMAKLAPDDKFSWAGLAVIPLWFLLGIYLESVIAASGSTSKTSRAFSIIAVLGGFYGTWFAIRGVGP
jgi:ABC-type spermidine/putrescine transport system permease subunit II